MEHASDVKILGSDLDVDLNKKNINLENTHPSKTIHPSKAMKRQGLHHFIPLGSGKKI